MLRVSVSASSAARARIASATLKSSVPRSRAAMRGHGPSSNAGAPRPIARETSAAVASGTRAMTLPSAGLITSRVPPSEASTHALSIHIFVGDI